MPATADAHATEPAAGRVLAGCESPALASDADRERAVALLSEHWLDGRLTLPELEARSEEAWRARFVSDLWRAVRELPVPVPVAPAPLPTPSDSSAVLSLVLGVLGTCLPVLTFGLLFVVSLPLSATAWVCGRRSRRQAALAGAPTGMAMAGETLGGVGVVLGLMALGGCAALLIGAD